MGFFSSNCKGCGASIKAPYNLPTEIEWQNVMVAISPSGELAVGSYDGYGRVQLVDADLIREDEPLVEIAPDAEWWHRRCWTAHGEPDYVSPSEHSYDQGFFYDRTEAGR